MKEHSFKLIAKAVDTIEATEYIIDKGKYDIAAGRAYFAMYYVAQALLNEKGLNFNRHSAVHAAFGEHFAKSNGLDTKFHKWLLDGFDTMIASDYGVDIDIERDVAMNMNRQAREFLEAAREYLEKPQT